MRIAEQDTAASSDASTRTLARFVAESDLASIPEGVRADARRSLLNWFGCTIAGAGHEAVTAGLGAMNAAGVSGPARVLGRTERLDALSATTINGMSSAILDFDSTQHKKTNIHPSGPVAPALLALADVRQVSGPTFLHAYILGTEVACRVANAVFGKANPGWHVTGVAGGLGSAAGAGRILGLDTDRMVAAIGIAATQASGLREMYGTMCKALTPGRSGENGLLAALLAERRFTGADRPIEGAKGLAAVFAGVTDLHDLANNMGDSYEICFNTHKPWPCAIVTHAVIDACIALAQRHAIAPEDISGIDLHVSAIAVELAGKATPRDGLESKFSLHHAAAVAFTRLSARVDDFSQAAIADPLLASLRARTVVADIRPYRKNEAEVTVTLRSGARHSHYIEHALGSPANPMGDSHVAAKFMALAAPVIGDTHAADLRDAILSIETHGDVSALTALASRSV